jgi:GT2 family glycosyltransferase
VQASTADVVPASVVIATIGPADRVEACLKSISECEPRPAEIIVVDQSGDDAVHAAVVRFATAGARLLTTSVRGKSPAVNKGVEDARNEIVLLTDDDCTVATTWAATAFAYISADLETIVTGRVLPAGDAAGVASLVGLDEPRDYTGEIHDDVLFGCNMACSRSSFLALGGFDEGVNLVEDNDFCYRWLRAEHRLQYDPALLVWHHGWRTAEELQRQFRGYARSQGIFYAKHLRQRDLGVLRFLARDIRRATRAILARILRGSSEWPDARLALPFGVTAGLLEGWKRYGSRRR